MITTAPTKLALSIKAVHAELPMEEWPTFLADRAICDDPANVDPSNLQILPYITLYRNSTENEPVGVYALSYVRGKAGGEGRLHDLRSIGFGGHMETWDGNIVDTIVEEGIRELEEELGYLVNHNQMWTATIQALRVHRLIYLPTTEVGSVHLGISIMLDHSVSAAAMNVSVDSIDQFTGEQGQIEGLKWVNLDAVTPEELERYEPWSNHLIGVYHAQAKQLAEQLASDEPERDALAEERMRQFENESHSKGFVMPTEEAFKHNAAVLAAANAQELQTQ